LDYKELEPITRQDCFDWRLSVLDLKAHIQSKIKAAARVDFDLFFKIFSSFDQQHLRPVQISYKLMGQRIFIRNDLFKFFEDIIMAMLVKSMLNSSGVDINKIGSAELIITKRQAVDWLLDMDKNKRAEFTALINELVAMVKGEGVKVIERSIANDTPAMLFINEQKEVLKKMITDFANTVL
jgi:hypothetical protein